MSKETEFFTVGEFSKASKYKESTVRKYVMQRRIGSHRIGRKVLIPKSELTRLISDYIAPVIPNDAA